MTSEMVGARSRRRSALGWLIVITLLTMVSLGAPARVVAEEQEHPEATGEEHGTTEEHGEEHGEAHHHKNHFALFVGSTEAEEHHGEKGDRDFTLGIDYERRLSKWFGAGAMLDWVAEGNREYLVGPLFILHAGGHAKFFAAPCYQGVRESGEGNFVFRTGFAWDFFFGGGKYSVFPRHLLRLRRRTGLLYLWSWHRQRVVITVGQSPTDRCEQWGRRDGKR